jgi:hypothetical protein
MRRESRDRLFSVWLSEVSPNRVLPLSFSLDWGAEMNDTESAVQAAVPATFAALVREWKATRGPTSSAARMARHPAYQKIVAMGDAALPLLLAELERSPDHWFAALWGEWRRLG